MNIIPENIHKATEEIAKLPGIGPRTARRLVYFLLKRDDDVNKQLGKTITELNENIKHCSECQNVSENEKCAVCENTIRNKQQICIVESPIDAFNIESTGYDGVYFVLHGQLSPIDGITPEKLKITQLVDKIKIASKNGVVEVIFATSPSMEGESTAMYIKKQIENTENISCTTLAQGLPIGADLEYIDEFTLRKAIEGRS